MIYKSSCEDVLMAQTRSVSTVGVQPWSVVTVSQCGISTADDGDFVLGRGAGVDQQSNVWRTEQELGIHREPLTCIDTC